MNFLTNKLSAITKHSKGKMPKNLGSENSKRTIPYIDIKAFETDEIRRYCDDSNVNICLPTDTLIVWDGARFGLSGIGKNGAVGSTIMKLTPTDSLNFKYYYYFIKSKYLEINGKPRGVGIPHVEPSFFWNLEITYPEDKQDQQKIVDKIEELFSVIDHQNNQIQLLTKQASTIRQSLLKVVVSGKIVPFKTLKKATLKELGRWSGGGTPSKSIKKFWKDGDIPWVSPKDMKSRFIIDSQDKITQEAVDNSSAKLIGASSLLIVTRSGILRRTLPVAVAKVDVTVNQDIKALTPDENKILGDYLLILFEAFNQDIRYKCSKSGTTVESIEYPTLLRYEVEYPSIDEQKKVIQLVNEFESIIFAEERSLKETNKIANRLKQSILKQAFEGKLV